MIRGEIRKNKDEKEILPPCMENEEGEFLSSGGDDSLSGREKEKKEKKKKKKRTFPELSLWGYRIMIRRTAQ